MTSPRERSPRPPRDRRVFAVLALPVLAVLAVGALFVHSLVSSETSLFSSASMVGEAPEDDASQPTASTTPSASPTPSAGPSASTAPKSLGTVRGRYVLRGPSGAPAGSWAVFALTGPQKLVRHDTTPPFRAAVDTRKLRNGTYTLNVMLISKGKPARTATRTLQVRNTAASRERAERDSEPAKDKPSRGDDSGGSGGSAGGDASVTGQVVRLTNAERAKAGCEPLAIDSRLTASAQAHSADMAAKGYFSHNSQDGRDPFDRMKGAGYSYRMAAENIAWGQRTPAAVMDAWMNSAGHRANILNCQLTEIGVGYAVNAGGSPYWTQNFGTPA